MPAAFRAGLRFVNAFAVQNWAEISKIPAAFGTGMSSVNPFAVQINTTRVEAYEMKNEVKISSHLVIS